MKYYQLARTEIDSLLDKYIISEAPTPYIRKILSQIFRDGKRLRPIISLEMMKSFHESATDTQSNCLIHRLIIIPELIHSASLVIDDLPSMDNDTHRRNEYTIHYEYGETTAQMIVFYLLSRVYCLLFEDLAMLEKQKIPSFYRRRELILQCLSDNLGVSGAAHGQYLDTLQLPNNPILACETKDEAQRQLKDLLVKKTATFFELSFVISYLALGGDLQYLTEIKDISKHFGLAFQISDDFQDQESDATRVFCPNYVNHTGKKEAITSFRYHIKQCKEGLAKYNLFSQTYQEIFSLIESRVSND